MNKEITLFMLLIMTLIFSNAVNGCIKINEQTKIWVYMHPVKCLDNAWEQDWVNISGLTGEESFKGYKEYLDKTGEKKIIIDYYAKIGITVYDYTSEKVSDVVCEACECQRGDRVSLLIPYSNSSNMKQLGYNTTKIQN